LSVSTKAEGVTNQAGQTGQRHLYSGRAPWARVDELARMRAAFGPEPRRGRVPDDASGVLLPIVPRPEGAALVYTRRAATLRRHAGEISFPGGGVEPGERPLDAALRETEEEVGLARGQVEVLGHLTDFVTHYGRLVCAYGGAVRAADVPARARSSGEVEELLLVAVARLLDPAVYEARALPAARGGLDALPAQTEGERVVHYFHAAPPGVPVWGITGELTARFLARAFGWAPPRAPRRILDPQEFRPKPS
jgi:8-oxo-dGTP pyrophosphatase MutT (NUDIX family)